MATSHPVETPVESDVDIDEAVKQILAEMEAEEQDPLEGMGNAQVAEIYHCMTPEDQRLFRQFKRFHKRYYETHGHDAPSHQLTRGIVQHMFPGLPSADAETIAKARAELLQEFQALLSDVAAQHQRMAASLDALASRVEDMSVEQVEEVAVRVVSESGHVRGLIEITNVFDKSEVALILACGVRRYQEYQALKGKREDKDIISYRQLRKKFGTNKRTLMEVVQGYKYRYPGSVSTKVPFTATKPEEGGEVPATSQTAPSERPQHNISPYWTTTKFSVLSGPPNPPKVEIYLRKAIRRHFG